MTLFINSKGIQITECKYIYVENFAGGMAKVVLDLGNTDDVSLSNTAGFINKQGKEIVKTEYPAYTTQTYNLGNGYAILYQDN